MSRKLVPVEQSFAKWHEDPAYRAAYEAMEEEFALASALIKARSKASVSQKKAARARIARNRLTPLSP